MNQTDDLDRRIRRLARASLDELERGAGPATQLPSDGQWVRAGGLSVLRPAACDQVTVMVPTGTPISSCVPWFSQGT